VATSAFLCRHPHTTCLAIHQQPCLSFKQFRWSLKTQVVKPWCSVKCFNYATQK